VDLYELMASLVYRVNSKAVRDTKRNPASEKKKKNQTRPNQKLYPKQTNKALSYPEIIL
jgi:hypothetical protein